jgi:thymidylate synthase ThyX
MQFFQTYKILRQVVKAKIIADSINVATEDRLTTFLLEYPRYLHAEVMTHRVFSRNASSSRSIPIAKFRDEVMENPVIPEHWGANQKGMQAADELDDTDATHLVVQTDIADSPWTGKMTKRRAAKHYWMNARDQALYFHEMMEGLGLHKQIANRIIEPWFHIKLLVSATEYRNFFSLRCDSAAHPDIQALADAMLYAYMTGLQDRKRPGEWHLPFGDQDLDKDLPIETVVKVCVARAARLSYNNFEGVIDVASDVKLYERLSASGHWSPFEHPAKAMPHGTWHGNFRGWLQHRKEFNSENRVKYSLETLWEERKKNGTRYARGPAATVNAGTSA